MLPYFSGEQVSIEYQKLGGWLQLLPKQQLPMGRYPYVLCYITKCFNKLNMVYIESLTRQAHLKPSRVADNVE